MTIDPRKIREIAGVCAVLSNSAATAEEYAIFADLAAKWLSIARERERGGLQLISTGSTTTEAHLLLARKPHWPGDNLPSLKESLGSRVDVGCVEPRSSRERVRFGLLVRVDRRDGAIDLRNNSGDRRNSPTNGGDEPTNIGERDALRHQMGPHRCAACADRISG